MPRKKAEPTVTLHAEARATHTTRPSDASSFDGMCVDCGATDRPGNNMLSAPCPGKPKEPKPLEVVPPKPNPWKLDYETQRAIAEAAGWTSAAQRGLDLCTMRLSPPENLENILKMLIHAVSGLQGTISSLKIASHRTPEVKS